MASSLTIAQKIAFYECLDVPYATSYNTLSGIGTLSSSTSVAGAGSSAAYTAINTWLDTLDSTNGETQLITNLNRWIALGTRTAKIEGGSVDDVSGVTVNPMDERALIKDRVQKIVPFFRKLEVMMHENQTGAQSIIFLR